MGRNLCNFGFQCIQAAVALLAEGVGRNSLSDTDMTTAKKSPSSRRAWVEIGDAINGSAYTTASPSSRRAWVEMPYSSRAISMSISSPSSRRAWVEISCAMVYLTSLIASPSSRRAWVEITVLSASSRGQLPVALLAEGVGRNRLPHRQLQQDRQVALLAEGVGRNQVRFAFCMASSTVALLAEGVGRNGKPVHINSGYRVALLAEGVGRNAPPKPPPKLP